MQTFIQIVRFRLIRNPIEIKSDDIKQIINSWTKISESMTVTTGKLELRLWNHLNHLHSCFSDLGTLLCALTEDIN